MKCVRETWLNNIWLNIIFPLTFFFLVCVCCKIFNSAILVCTLSIFILKINIPKPKWNLCRFNNLNRVHREKEHRKKWKPIEESFPPCCMWILSVFDIFKVQQVDYETILLQSCVWMWDENFLLCNHHEETEESYLSSIWCLCWLDGKI